MCIRDSLCTVLLELRQFLQRLRAKTRNDLSFVLGVQKLHFNNRSLSPHLQNFRRKILKLGVALTIIWEQRNTCLLYTSQKITAAIATESIQAAILTAGIVSTKLRTFFLKFCIKFSFVLICKNLLHECAATLCILATLLPRCV